ncbi:MAG: hypothetical protein FJZ88_05375 [Chloroflexi bacterium]|nr:hypothetical protein [Chloroflexota bacterium]
MDSVIEQWLQGVVFGDMFRCRNMVVVPLFSSIDDSPGYLVLEEALKRKVVTVTEVSEGGSVPYLMAVNDSATPVLILDGEELVGAKQNRVLNTTVFLKGKSRTKIPVSCVEQGRWAYASRHFTTSSSVMACELRARKYRGVARSLREEGIHCSDQGDVWVDVQDVLSRAGVHSPTRAMKQAFDARKNDLDEYLSAFPWQAGQKGLMVLVNGEVAGLDFLSLDEACDKVYPKLLRSYAMNALVNKEKGAGRSSLEKAKAFVGEIASLEEERYQAPGEGWDYRYSGKDVAGSVLVLGDTVLHAAFLKVKPRRRSTQMMVRER